MPDTELPPHLSNVAPAETAAAPDPPRGYRPGRWDIWILGLSIGLGGQYFNWNDGLRAGLFSFLLIYAVVGFAYIALCCCTSEITGALPFAGGAYGLSRCTLGFYAGFLVGCAEALEYIVYVATSIIALAKMLVESIPELAGLEPLIWLVFYVSSLYFHVRGDVVFWRWNAVIGALSLFFVLLYCIGAFPHANFAVNADDDHAFRFVNGGAGFLRSLPLSCWFFVGVEALSLASDDVLDPKHAIPFAQVTCIVSLFVTGLVVLLVTVSLPPPGLNHIAKLLAPFDNGFQLIFDVSAKTATLFSIPAMYATTFGFMWGYGKLIAAMATSKLLPPVLARPHPTYGTPYLAVISGSVVSYCVSLVVFYTPAITDKYVFNLCVAMAFLGYAAQCIGYVSLKKNYPNIKSSAFRSPFGICGALYSLAVWLLGLVSVAFFQENDGVEIACFLAILLVLTAFYFGYAQSRQTLSSQEHKVFLLAHVMKFYKNKRRRRQHAADASSPPTRLIVATGLMRPALTLQQLHLGRSQSLPGVLKLPKVVPLPHATPFHCQFARARPRDPYGHDDELHELQGAGALTPAMSSGYLASLVEMLVAASDDARRHVRSASFPPALGEEKAPTSSTRSSAVGSAQLTAKAQSGACARLEADNHSKRYRNIGVECGGDLAAWERLGVRYSTFFMSSGGDDAASHTNSSATKTSGEQEGGATDE
ncbi:hypothetical protein PybrP1_008451 [[Pythium] brassicae (nom. inval.)]|nr:hypothetical protein PybrP1_008451 [[Pythium] brassicae (nom. inval.)]